MPNDQFERIMRFAARTGDRLIVTDPAGNEPLVIMSLDEYEALVEGALGPGDYAMTGMEDDFDEDEYGDAPTLEIVERMADESVDVTPAEPPIQTAPQPSAFVRPTAVPEFVKPEAQRIPEKQVIPSEEQFYLEPL